MKISVRRFEYGTNFTVSKLYINDTTEFECYVLEDVVRAPGVKVKGETAIPAGTYTVTIDYSPHFGKNMPHILNVPMFEGIRIHSGNTDVDTEGCLLLGSTWGGGDYIGGSRDAFNKFFPKLSKAIADKETVTITIIDTK
jgi:hypothetical protein